MSDPLKSLMYCLVAAQRQGHVDGFREGILQYTQDTRLVGDKRPRRL